MEIEQIIEQTLKECVALAKEAAKRVGMDLNPEVEKILSANIHEFSQDLK